LPVALKGILTAEDARLAVDAGIDAIFVSNHGARQVDCAPAAVSEIVFFSLLFVCFFDEGRPDGWSGHEKVNVLDKNWTNHSVSVRLF